jgi:hypothetical protein
VPSEDTGSDVVEEEEEDECPEDEELFEEEAEMLITEESETLLDAAASPSAVGSPNHHHHHSHHHPSWSLRNDDRHPDLWPWSRPTSSKASSTRSPKTTVPHQNPEPVTSEEVASPVTAEESDVPTRKTNAQRSNQSTASAIPLTTTSPVEQRAEWAKAKKEEYDRNCGALWTDYRQCLQVGRSTACNWNIADLLFDVQRAIDANHPLSALLTQARLENPIEEAEKYEDGGYGAPDAQP